MRDLTKLLSVVLVFLFVASGCSIQKRRYNNGFHVEWFHSSPSKPVVKPKSIPLAIVDSIPTISFDHINDLQTGLSSFDRLDILGWQSHSDSVKCDIMVLRNGDEVDVKVIEVGERLVKYKMCNNLDGPIFTKRSSEIFMLKYPNGTKTVMSNTKEETEQSVVDERVVRSGSSRPSDSRRDLDNPRKVINASALISLLASMVGIFIFGIPMGIVAVIFGLVGLGKIINNPDDYSGKGFAIAGLILGLLDIIIVLLYVL
jgi:Domain of unknown function (DUF4190)